MGVAMKAKLGVAAGLFAMPAAASTDPFLGEIRTFAYGSCPSGWLPLDGRSLSIIENTALFQLLGTTYGGDGFRTFAIPKVNPVPTATGAPLTQCIAILGTYPPPPSQ